MRKAGVLFTILLLLALVPAVLAGGWAVITLDEMPGEIHAGEPWTVGFTVLQHGQTPVHDLGPDGGPIEPTLIATNPETGERVRAVGTPTKDQRGHFTIEVTFPSEGAWEWTIDPMPLLGETQFQPLTVLPAVAPVVAPETQVEPAVAAEPAVAVVPTTAVDNGSPVTALRWGALVVALLAAALFVLQNRRRAQPVGAES